jgi:hypothetical protein
MAIACFVDRAPCLPSRMCSISSRTNSPAWVVAAFPSRFAFRARLTVFRSGIDHLRGPRLQSEDSRADADQLPGGRNTAGNGWEPASEASGLAKAGGEGGIRTHVPLTGQDAFEAPPLRPLRYLSVFWRSALRSHVAARSGRGAAVNQKSAIRQSPIDNPPIANRESSIVNLHAAAAAGRSPASTRGTPRRALLPRRASGD